MKRHTFRIDGDDAVQEGDRARCIHCGISVVSCLRKVGDVPRRLRAIKVVDGRYINGGWHASTPREFTAADRRCRP